MREEYRVVSPNSIPISTCDGSTYLLLVLDAEYKNKVLVSFYNDEEADSELYSNVYFAADSFTDLVNKIKLIAK